MADKNTAPPSSKRCFFCGELPVYRNGVVFCDTIERNGDDQELCDFGSTYPNVEAWNARHTALKEQTGTMGEESNK
jgi:hypothetical protein